MFSYKYAFWLFLLIPLIFLIIFFEIFNSKKRVKKISGDNKKQIIPYYSEGQKWLKLVFYTIAFSLCVLSIARPKWGIKTADIKFKGKDILFLLDVSYSMQTGDVIPSRFEIAKKNIIDFIKSKKGNKIGIRIFSGESELICPITFDYSSVLFFLDSLYPGYLGKNGTNIGNAIYDSKSDFEDDVGIQDKIIILITDGENLQGNIGKYLNKIKKSGIRIYTAGVGMKGGEPIPIYNDKGNVIDYVKDNNNKPVLSKLNENVLKLISKETNGKYLGRINNIGRLKYSINYLDKSTEKKEYLYNLEDREDRYDIFLIPALILFFLGFILDQGKLFRIKENKFKWLIYQGGMKLFIFILITFIFFNNNYIFSNNDDFKIKKSNKKIIWKGRENGGFWGNIFFNKKKYKKSLEYYISSLIYLKGEEYAKLVYNIGNVYLKFNDFKKAEEYYNKALNVTNDESLKSQIFFNYGILAFNNQNFTFATELFKNALKLNPEDDDARYNYSICKLLKDELNKDYFKKINKKFNKNNNVYDNNNNNNNMQKINYSIYLNKEDIDKLLKALDEKEKKENKERELERQNKNNNRTNYW